MPFALALLLLATPVAPPIHQGVRRQRATITRHQRVMRVFDAPSARLRASSTRRQRVYARLRRAMGPSQLFLPGIESLADPRTSWMQAPQRSLSREFADET